MTDKGYYSGPEQFERRIGTEVEPMYDDGGLRTRYQTVIEMYTPQQLQALNVSARDVLRDLRAGDIDPEVALDVLLEEAHDPQRAAQSILDTVARNNPDALAAAREVLSRSSDVLEVWRSLNSAMFPRRNMVTFTQTTSRDPSAPNAGLAIGAGVVAGAALGYIYDRSEKEFAVAGALVGGLVGLLYTYKEERDA